MECTIQQLMQQQLRLMELFSERFSTPSPSPSETKLTSAEPIARSIMEFHYDPMAKSTFCTWFSRFEGLFRVEFKEQADDWKVRLLLRKLGSSEHDRHANYILPKHPRDYNFDGTVETLSQIFGEQISLFNMRFNCLNITKSDSTDFSTYAGIVNRECERFKITSITDAQFKCLIFVCGLRSAEDTDFVKNRAESRRHLTTSCRRMPTPR